MILVVFKCSFSIVRFQGLVEGIKGIMKMDMEDVDMILWMEVEFEEKCIYIVNDYFWDFGVDGGIFVQVEVFLLRNLFFKYVINSREVIGVMSKEYILKGICFGFLIGEIYINDIVFKNVNRKYFWRIYFRGEFYYFIDGFNEEKSNWMCYVNLVYFFWE